MSGGRLFGCLVILGGCLMLWGIALYMLLELIWS